MKKAIRVGLEKSTIAERRTNAVMASKDTDHLQNPNYYICNHRLLVFSGLWPYQESSKRLLRIRIINLILALSIIAQIGALIISDYKLESTMDQIGSLLPSMSFAYWYYNVCNNYVTVKLLFDRIRYKWNETDNEDELKCMKKYYEESKFYLFMLSCILFIYFILMMYPSMINVILYTAGLTDESQLTLPIPVEYCLTNRIRYFFALPIEYFFTVTTCTIGVVYGTIHLSFVQHACTLFDIVMMKIDEPFKKNPDKFCWVSSNNKHDEEYDWIVTVVKCYNEAINYVELVKLVCEKSLPVEASLALLFIVIDILYILQLNNIMENLKQTAQNFMYIGGTLIITYTYSYLGQKVIDQNNNLYTKCCQVPIYTLSVKTQKILLLLITRITRPCNFSVKGILIVSHEVFLNIIRTSYTFAMVFHNTM